MRLSEEYGRGLNPWFRAFSKMQLPKIPFDDPEAAGLRGDLISYDSYIAGFLSRLTDGQEVSSKKLRPNRTLMQQFEELCERRPELQPFAYGCLDYLDTVHGIIETVKEQALGSEL